MQCRQLCELGLENSEQVGWVFFFFLFKTDVACDLSPTVHAVTLLTSFIPPQVLSPPTLPRCQALFGDNELGKGKAGFCNHGVLPGQSVSERSLNVMKCNSWGEYETFQTNEKTVSLCGSPQCRSLRAASPP